MKQVYSAANPPEAHLVRAILESHGIACEVRGDTLFTLRGRLPWSPDTAPSVWLLDESMYDDARALVAEYEATHQGGADDGLWTCPHCGQQSEGQFTDCWNCGKPRVGMADE